MTSDSPDDSQRPLVQHSPWTTVDAVVDLSRRRWGWILGVVGMSVAISAAAAFLMTPIYRAEVVLAPQTRSSAQDVLGALGRSFGGLAPFAGIGSAATAETQYAIAVLRSNGFARSFIQENHLLEVLFERDWDSTQRLWIGRKRTLNDGVKLFDRSVRTVSIDPQTGIVTLRIEWKDPRLAADWANDLARRLNQTVRTRTIDDATRSIDYLNAELVNTPTLELREVLFRVLEAEASRRMLANVNEQYAFRVVDPAIAPNSDAPVRPRLAVMISVGALLGLILGLLAALVADYRPRSS